MELSDFPGKIPVTRKIFFNFLSVASPYVAPKPTDQSFSNSIPRFPLQISLIFFIFYFRPTLKIKGSSYKEQETYWVTNMPNCFCCYFIKSPGETAKKVLLSVIWNLPLIEISLSQIRNRTVNARKYVRCVRTFYFTYITFTPLQMGQNFHK